MVGTIGAFVRGEASAGCRADLFFAFARPAEDLLVFASGGLADSRQDDERTRVRKAFWYTGSLACLIVVAVMSALVLWMVR